MGPGERRRRRRRRGAGGRVGQRGGGAALAAAEEGAPPRADGGGGARVPPRGGGARPRRRRRRGAAAAAAAGAPAPALPRVGGLPNQQRRRHERRRQRPRAPPPRLPPRPRLDPRGQHGRGAVGAVGVRLVTPPPLWPTLGKDATHSPASSGSFLVQRAAVAAAAPRTGKRARPATTASRAHPGVHRSPSSAPPARREPLPGGRRSVRGTPCGLPADLHGQLDVACAPPVRPQRGLWAGASLRAPAAPAARTAPLRPPVRAPGRQRGFTVERRAQPPGGVPPLMGCWQRGLGGSRRQAPRMRGGATAGELALLPGAGHNPKFTAAGAHAAPALARPLCTRYTNLPAVLGAAREG